MSCPFLREAHVRTCRTAPVRKLIPSGGSGATDERCSGPGHADCPAYLAARTTEAPGPRCPFLDASVMQYCGAAPVPKFVPYSESLLSRCGSDAYRYCELYLSMARPPHRLGEEVDGVPVPEGRWYTANHMWLDIASDGSCHAGVDAFLSRALGRVDHISYIWLKGRHRPGAVVSVDGTDFELVFPNPMLITSCNLYLRADPSRLTSDPYAAGWLWEGTPDAETLRNLIDAAEARRWVGDEVGRVNEFLQRQQGISADGGMLAPGLIRALARQDRLSLFHEFFSSYESHGRQS